MALPRPEARMGRRKRAPRLGLVESVMTRSPGRSGLLFEPDGEDWCRSRRNRALRGCGIGKGY